MKVPYGFFGELLSIRTIRTKSFTGKRLASLCTPYAIRPPVHSVSVQYTRLHNHGLSRGAGQLADHMLRSKTHRIGWNPRNRHRSRYNLPQRIRMLSIICNELAGARGARTPRFHYPVYPNFGREQIHRLHLTVCSAQMLPEEITDSAKNPRSLPSVGR